MAQFERFLARPAFHGEFAGTSFAKDVRNKIFHEAETRKWLIWRSSAGRRIAESLEGSRYILYRNEFYDAIQQEFAEYTDSLRSNYELRIKFLEQMDRIPLDETP